MPELPEVELVARALGERVAGRTIAAAELRRQKLAPDITPKIFAKRLSGASIQKVSRRGKHLLLGIDNGRTLIVHLRMSGRFMLLTADDADPKFAHAVLHFDDDSRLVFDDQRHFGLMKLVDTSKLFDAKELAKLAPEPFSEDFSPEYLITTIRSSNRVLKEILLDQTKVCGVGNIYASEAMFRSGLDPRKRGTRVAKARIGLLHETIRAVLSEAIALLETVERHPTNIGEGVYGNGSEGRWLVYDREGEACPVCISAIKRIVQGGRSTYFCQKCQR